MMVDIASQLKELDDAKRELRKFINALQPEIATDKDGFNDLMLKLQEAGAWVGLEESAVLELSENGDFYKFIGTTVDWREQPSNTYYRLIIPSNKNGIPVKTIEAEAFVTREGTSAFSSLYIPETIETLKTKSFKNTFVWNPSRKIVLPKSVKNIEEKAFFREYPLTSEYETATELYIMGSAENMNISPNAFYPNAFSYINCAFGEGEVAGAPWGATNAEIRYNVKYTGGEY